MFIMCLFLVLAAGFIGYAFWQNKRDMEHLLESAGEGDSELEELPTRKVTVLYYIGAVFGGCFILSVVAWGLQLAMRVIEAGVGAGVQSVF